MKESSQPPADGTDNDFAVDVSIVVPTYLEAENLPPLIERITAAMAATEHSYEIIIADDNSRDGTAELVSKLFDAGNPIRSVCRIGERGLATAVMRGFDESRGRLLVCIDADLSHPPEAIPRMVAALVTSNDAPADFVIGSRYVPGGGTDEDWGLLRWINSRIATLLARPFTNVRDPMAGFFALRRETYAQSAPLNPIGYKIALELIVKCRVRNVVEIPIQFANRHAGKSKLNLREQFRYLRHLTRLARFKFLGSSRPD